MKRNKIKEHIDKKMKLKEKKGKRQKRYYTKKILYKIEIKRKGEVFQNINQYLN